MTYAQDMLPGTLVFACASHLALFYVLVGCFLATLDLHVHITSLKRSEPLRRRSCFSCGV